MTDDDRVVEEPGQIGFAAHGGGTEDDRRAVRSEAEGAVPDEQQTVGASGQAGPAPSPRPAAEPGDALRSNAAPAPVGDGFAPSGSASTPVVPPEPLGAAPPPSPDALHSAADEDSENESADEIPGRDQQKKQGSFWKELPVLIGVALVLALVIKAFAVQAFYIPSQSMENTLKIGDRVLVNKIVYHTRDIQRGDVVVFNGLDSWDPEVTYAQPTNPVSKVLHAVGGFFGLVPGEKDYIKRVIGVGGDHVQCAGNGAPVLVNGHPLVEQSYLYPGNVASAQAFDIWVPQGRLWVMGDHREVSADSRYHLGEPGGGTISTSKVVGRAFVVVWPVDRWKTLPIPSTFEQSGLAAAAVSATPLALGFVGAVPVTLFYRRFRRVRCS